MIERAAAFESQIQSARRRCEVAERNWRQDPCGETLAAARAAQHARQQVEWRALNVEMAQSGHLSALVKPDLPTILDVLLRVARADGIKVGENWTIARLRRRIAKAQFEGDGW
jgi:hypothetical protein